MSKACDWEVTYTIGDSDVEYKAIVPDGSDPVGSKVRYIGESEEDFKSFIETNHPDVDYSDIEVVHSINLDHPLASFF